MHFLSDHLIIPALVLILLLTYLINYYVKIQSEYRRNIIVLFISAGLIAWLDYLSFILLLFYSSIMWWMIKREIKLKSFLAVFVVVNIALLLLIKDYWRIFHFNNPYIPLGVSYYFFRLISVGIEYSRTPEQYKKISALDYYVYVFFFPIFLAGPIQRLKDFKRLTLQEITSIRGTQYRNLIIAISTKIFVVNSLLSSIVYSDYYPLLMYRAKHGIVSPATDVMTFGLLAFFHAYLDLMLYTEISKGISRLLGFAPVENFNKPLLASNISQFWQRWHMSLSNWTRDYVFMPMLIKTRNTWLSTYMSMFTIGLWHSATASWLAWAFFHASAINLYSIVRQNYLYVQLSKNTAGRYLLRFSGNIITLLFVSTVFIIVAMENFHLAVFTIMSLFR